MRMPSWFRRDWAAVALGALAIGIGIGTYLAPLFRVAVVQHDIYQFANKYHFINPLLACSADQNIDDAQAGKLETQLHASITSHTTAGDVTLVSVYYRDLSGSSSWVGINIDTPFSPGSLLKVPLAMSVYKIADADPGFLSKRVSYEGTETNDQQYFSAAPLAAGTYTVQQLVEQMLEYSNNNAANVLANTVGGDNFEATYQHLGITQPPVVGTDYTTDTHDYVSFFRVLYNATYLDDDDSERLLQLMSKASFTEGLVAGVPAGVTVSHKFGERSYTGSNLLQLHDCGIVYAPNHPYLICVMTQGYNYPQMAKTIADISSVVYNYVE